MSYRISYEKKSIELWRWGTAAICFCFLAWCASGMGPVWQALAAGEGLYDALVRFVGGCIHAFGG